MAKFFGKIGFGIASEIRPGVWSDDMTVREYFGEMTRNAHNLQSASQANDNMTLSNELSIISDPFALENFQSIKFVEYLGAKWKVTNVDVQYPRLILRFGGEYNWPTD